MQNALRQLLRIMRITAFLLFVAGLHVSARTVSQTVTFKGTDVPVKTVLSAIEQQTGFALTYNPVILETAHPVTMDVANMTLVDFLDKLSEDQPFEFLVSKKTIFLTRKSPPVVSGNAASFIERSPFIEIRGKVTNEQGQPLSGANVIIKRTGRGTITDVKGAFVIRGVKPGDYVVFSFVGYSAQVILLKEQSDLQVIMQVATNDLDKVVVQAYGITSRRLTTSNIAGVSAEEIERQPVINPLMALQGKVAGLDVTQMNGYASAPYKVELRGRSNIGVSPTHTFPSDPLYIIDGVPLTVVEIGGGSSYELGSTGFTQSGFFGPAGGQSPFFSINPSDIESIEVLKDADATAIYGSRGANGVILVTTKKGKSGKTKFDLRMKKGVTHITKVWSMLNTQQYLQMRREALANDGIQPSLGHGDYDLLTWDTTRYTDWQKMLVSGTGKSTDVQASLSGGDARTVFRLGGGYNRTTNILTVSGADQRASANVSLAHSSLDRRLSFSFVAAYSYSHSGMVQFPGGALTLPPNAPGIYDAEGNLNFEGWGGAGSAARNLYPFGVLKQPYSAGTNFLNSSLEVGYQPLKGLRLSTSIGYNNAQTDQKQYIPIISIDPALVPTGTALVSYNNNKNWIVEPQATYDLFLGKGKLSVLAGGSIQHNTTTSLYINASGYTSDALIKSLSNATTLRSNDLSGEYRYAGAFGRLTYDWENKYIININGRRDGSSRFGAGRQFGNFGSIGAAWLFSQEKWFKLPSRWISFGKLRGSYGTTGADAIGDYQYLTRWSANNTNPYAGLSSIVPIQHANPYYQWEINRKVEGGIDIGFFKDRLNFSIVYYQNRCGNQLGNFPVSAFTGFGSVTANFPGLVQNKGWEYMVRTKIISTSKVTWNVNANVAFNKNKLLYYPNLSQSPFAGTLVVGQPLNILHIMNYVGVDPQTGQYAFEDKNHDGQAIWSPSSPIDDSYLLDLSPKFFGGGGMDFSYKNINISIFFSFKKQKAANVYTSTGIPGDIKNQSTTILGQQWQQPGDNASIAKFTTQPPYSTVMFTNFSDGSYTDASYIRLSNISLTYALPTTYAKKAGMQNCSLFLNANNLFVITAYKGLDPELHAFGTMPPTRTIVGGINLSF